jgi:hypothetical protein
VKIRETRKRLLALVATATVAGAVAMTPATTQASDVGIRMGYYFNAEAFSLGMEMLTPVGDQAGEWYFNPNVELAMGDVRDIAAFNADFHYDLDTNSGTAVWVGAGPALLVTDDQRFESDTEIDPALNMILGFVAKNGAYRPFVQGKGILSDHSEAALAVGIRF